MTGLVDNIEDLTLKNTHFRQVLYTSRQLQVVVMSLLPGEDIGLETHETVDQFLRVEQGEGKVVLNGEEHPLSSGVAIVVPAGVAHNVINTSATQPLKLYTLYAPPHHKAGTVHATKQLAAEDTTDHYA